MKNTIGERLQSIPQKMIRLSKTIEALKNSFAKPINLGKVDGWLGLLLSFCSFPFYATWCPG
jgi:hypothetical protein